MTDSEQPGSQGEKSLHWAVVVGAILCLAFIVVGILTIFGEQKQGGPAGKLKPAEQGTPAPTATTTEAESPSPEPATPSSSTPRPSSVDVNRELKKSREALFAGDFNTAIQSYRAILRVSPNNSRARSGLATAQLMKEDHEREEQQRQAQIRDLVVRAEDAVKRGDYSSAVQAYEKVLALDPDNEDFKQALQKAREAAESIEPPLV